MKTSSYHLTDNTGKSFFWLADTAWNIRCRGTPDEWDHYLAVRKKQGFNVIQFCTGWWRGCTKPIHGKPYELRDGKLVYDEAAWKSLDAFFAKIRDAGLVAAPINLWTLTDIDPGQVLSERHCIKIARKQVDRWDAPNVVWMLGGDGNYTSQEVEAKWKNIGRAAFVDHPDAVSTLHPCGQTWVGEAFDAEPWYKLATIQSGHGSQDTHLKFLVDGGYARAWKTIKKPFLNLEPNYEDAYSYNVRKHLTAYHVRRASYWSLLVAPPAGVTYGIGSIWIWSSKTNEIAENHDESWVGNPWRDELETPVARSMTILKQFFEKQPWTRLVPASERLKTQPGNRDIEAWQTVAATSEGDCLVAYAPKGGAVDVDTKGLREGLSVYAVDPRTGAWEKRGKLGDGPELFRLPEGAELDALIVIAE